MAANFGYNEQYVDEMLDMERLFAHLQYLTECPPAGMLIKAYFEAQAEANGDSSHASAPAPKKTEFKTEEERKNFERTQINNLCADFGVNINNLQPKPRRKLRVLPSQRKGGK